MDKKYFYIGLLSFLFAGSILAMTEEEFGQDLWLEPSQQLGSDIPIGHGFGSELGQGMTKRIASAAIPSAKKARKASSVNDVFTCGHNCNSTLKKNNHNICADIMVHLLFSREHNLDNYKFVHDKIEREASWNEDKGKWTVKCLKDLCEKKICTHGGSNSKEALAGLLMRHWCSKTHSPENFEKIKDYIRRVDSGENDGQCFYGSLFRELVEVRLRGGGLTQESSALVSHLSGEHCAQELPINSVPNRGDNPGNRLGRKPIKSINDDYEGSGTHYSLGCIYPTCRTQISASNGNPLTGNLIAHIYSRAHNKKLYNQFHSNGGSAVCPEESCRKVISRKSKGQICRDMLVHLHSEKHAPDEYRLLHAYASKALPELFQGEAIKKYKNKTVEEIRQEYIRLFPEQTE